MYTGTLIDDLIATVERAQKHAYARGDSREERLAYCYAPASPLYEMGQREPNLVGAA